MVNRPKAIGTAGESATVRLLRTVFNFPDTRCQRLTLSGRFDLGDVRVEFPDGTVAIIEVKSGKQADVASLQDITKWQRETMKERHFARANYGILLVKRNGYAPARVGYWRAFVRCDVLMPDALVKDMWVEAPFFEVMVTLGAIHGRYASRVA